MINRLENFLKGLQMPEDAETESGAYRERKVYLKKRETLEAWYALEEMGIILERPKDFV